MIFKKYSLIFRILLLASSMNLNLEAAEKKYPCTYKGCSSVFECQGHLTRHFRMHIGERPYACDYSGCDMRFARKYSLELHYMTHTGERPYACDYSDCDMRFARKDALKRHGKSHAGERLFLGCGKSISAKQLVAAEKNSALDVGDDLLDIENLSDHQDFDDLIGPVSEEDLTLPDSWSDDELSAPSVVTKKAKIEAVLPLLLPPLIIKSPKIDE